MRNLNILTFLALALSVQCSNVIAQNLFPDQLSIAGLEFPFDSEISITIETESGRSKRPSQIRRVVSVEGAVVDADLAIVQLVGELANACKNGMKYKLRGTVVDAYNPTDKSTVFSFAVAKVELIGESSYAIEEKKQIDLQDSGKQPTTLNGVIWSMNGNWWLEIGDEKVYLVDAQGRSLDFVHLHGTQSSVTGLVKRQLRLPVRDRMGLLKLHWVIFNAEVNLRKRLGPNPVHRQLFKSRPLKVDGVYVLKFEDDGSSGVNPTNTSRMRQNWNSNRPLIECILERPPARLLTLAVG